MNELKGASFLSGIYLLIDEAKREEFIHLYGIKMNRKNFFKIVLDSTPIDLVSNCPYSPYAPAQIDKLSKKLYSVINKDDAAIIRDKDINDNDFERLVRSCEDICRNLNIPDLLIWPNLSNTTLSKKREAVEYYGLWQEIRFSFSRENDESCFLNNLIKRAIIDVKDDGIVRAYGYDSSYTGNHKLQDRHTFIDMKKDINNIDSINQTYYSITQKTTERKGRKVKIGICLGSGMRFHSEEFRPIVANRTIYIRLDDLFAQSIKYPKWWKNLTGGNDKMRREYCTSVDVERDCQVAEGQAFEMSQAAKIAKEYLADLTDDLLYEKEKDGGRGRMIGNRLIVRN